VAAIFLKMRERLDLPAVWSLLRFTPAVLCLAAVVQFPVAERLDQRWQDSLRPARCDVVSARRQSWYAVSRIGGPKAIGTEYKARYVEETVLELRVQGTAPPRTARKVIDYRLDPAARVIDCWLPGEAGEPVVLSPGRERAERTRDNILSSFLLVILSMGWWAVAARLSGGTPSSRPPSS
jgi:hypothetical protein